MEKLYSIREAAEYLGVGRQTLERAIRRGLVRVVRVGISKRAIRQSDLIDYLERNQPRSKLEES